MSLPSSMRAIEITAPGGPEVLRPVSRPVPVPGVGEVLVRVAAAAVNAPDMAQRRGSYPPPPGASDLPGLDIAGTVVAHGPGVDAPAIGSEVCALVTGGGYAEYCTAAAALCLPVPAGLSLLQAASLPETFFTVWTNLIERGRLAAAESVLVQGGASGIGVAAIQIGTALGARVLATAGTDEKCAACERLGAVRAINYRSQDFVAVARELTGGTGVDVVLDMVGGDYVPRELEALAPEGRLVIIALQGGTRATLELWSIMAKRLTITGSTLRPRPVAFKAAIARKLRETVWPLIERGTIRPIIHATLPLQHAADAHRLLESRAHIGKVVLEVGA